MISRSGLEREISLRREPVVGFGGICLGADDRVGERRDSESGGDERNRSDVPCPRTAGCDRERLLPDDIDSNISTLLYMNTGVEGCTASLKNKND